MPADCIFTGWAGDAPPLQITELGTANIRNTHFRNLELWSEVVDVSHGGTVMFGNVSFANVTLQQGQIVSTSLNDYEPIEATYYCDSRGYYADDDMNYDVEALAVPEARRAALGADFVIESDVMSDCLWVNIADDLLLPGCPPQSADARKLLMQEACDDAPTGAAADHFVGANEIGLITDALEVRCTQQPSAELLEASTLAAKGPDQLDGAVRGSAAAAADVSGSTTEFQQCHVRLLSGDDPWLVAAVQVRLGRTPPWRMKLQCLARVAVFLLGVSSAACTRLPPSASVLASLHLPAWSSVHSWLLRLRFGSVSAPALLPAPALVWHMSVAHLDLA